MNTIEIPDRNITQEVPSHWDEMTAKQILKAIRLVTLCSAGRISETDVRIAMFYDLANVKRTWYSVFLENIMSAEWVADKNSRIYNTAYELTDFLFDLGKKELEINYNTVLNHFPEVRKTIGPAHLLADLTFGEFRAAVEELGEYFAMRTAAESDAALAHQLNRFIAVLYRPKVRNAKTGESRQPFTRGLIEINARQFRKVDPTIKLAVMLWFTHTIHYIQREDLTLGGSKISFASLFPKPRTDDERPSPSRAGSLSVWTSVLYNVSKEGPFGGIEATEKAGLFDVLLYMYQQHQEAKRIKAMSQKGKK